MPQASYIFGPGIDDNIAVTRGSQTFFYHRDGINSVVNLTDAAQMVRNSYEYEAFGRVRAQTENVVNDYKFTARQLDAESGLYHYRTRMHDPKIGRFTGSDTIDIFDGTNPYLYVGNNPTNFVDPDGEFAFLPILVFVAASALSSVVATTVASLATSGKLPTFKEVAVGVGTGLAVDAATLGLGKVFKAGTLVGKLIRATPLLSGSAKTSEKLAAAAAAGARASTRLSSIPAKAGALAKAVESGAKEKIFGRTFLRTTLRPHPVEAAGSNADPRGDERRSRHGEGAGGDGSGKGDVDGDGDIDLDDVNTIFRDRGKLATGPDDPRDLDGDGKITINDAIIARRKMGN